MTEAAHCLLVSFMAMSLSACSDRADAPRPAAEPVVAAATQPPSDFPPPPPLPPLPGSTFDPIPADVALKNAKAMGPGDCSDVSKIQGLPQPGQYGFDPYFDRIMVHIGSYRECLLEMTGSTAPTNVVPSFPGIEIHVVGDLAFFLLAIGHQVSWNDCLPKRVVEQKKTHESEAFHSWLRKPGHRAEWHGCLLKQYGTAKQKQA